MHATGCVVHIIYVMMLIKYVQETFLRDARWESNELDAKRLNPPAPVYYLYIIGGCLVYPLIYDGTQAMKQGFQYFEDPWNTIDIGNITLGFFNIYC